MDEQATVMHCPISAVCHQKEEFYLRIESRFWSFHEGYEWNNGCAHCMASVQKPPYKNVRIGYFIHTLHETTKISFQFL